MIIDPSNITNFALNKEELELHILFWFFVAGKNALTIANHLDLMLNSLKIKHQVSSPLLLLSKENDLEDLLKSYGFGCQRTKARGLRELIGKNLNLSTCSVEDLESIHGIGPKTARCFLMHTRKDVRHAGLDVHILKWLKSLGHDVPKNTPTGKKYKNLEEIFLSIADTLKMSPAELDLLVWNSKGKLNEKIAG